MSKRAGEILGRIQQYLALGGFFNPEAMEHDKVQRLVMNARDEIHDQASLLAQCIPHLQTFTRHCEACEGAGEIISPDDSAEPCPHCAPIWDLMRRIEPPPKPAPQLIEEPEDDIAF